MGTKEVGKWAFLIDNAHNATPLGRATTAATLSVHFTSTRNHSGLFVAHMPESMSQSRPVELSMAGQRGPSG